MKNITCISHYPTAEACDTTAMTSLHLLAVLDVLSSTPAGGSLLVLTTLSITLLRHMANTQTMIDASNYSCYAGRGGKKD